MGCEFPVIVVGAGPVGLCTALGLLRAGHAVLIFEQRPTQALDPRATTLQPCTLEMLDALGVFEAVDARSRRVTALEYWRWDASSHDRLAALSFRGIAGDTPTPFRLHCAQPALCEVLLAEVEGLFPGSVHWAHKVVGFREVGDGVDVEVEAGGVRRRIRGAWLVGADGARSMIRRSLDLPVRKLGPPYAFFTCETSLEIDAVLQARFGVRLADSAFLFTEHGWLSFMRLRDAVRLLFLTTHEGASALGSDALRGLTCALIGGEEGVELVHRAVYTVQQQVAERWRVGRVVVLGDAAHTTLPVSGTAMNSGMHDGVTLSRALAQGEDAVEAWAADRREALHSRVAHHARSAQHALSASHLLTRFARNRHLRQLDGDPAAAREHLLRASMLEDRLPG